jgi:multidrug resistance protein, MATE family
MAWKSQFKPTIILAAPVVITYMGQMLMSLVDTYMVGKLGPEAIGAVAIGNAVHYSIAVFGMGLILGLDYLVSRAYGRKDLGECHYWLIQATYFVLLISVPMTSAIYFSSFYFQEFGIASSISVLAGEFLRVLCWSFFPFVMFICLRQYLQAMNSVKVVTLITLLANVVNWALNWALIYGNAGAPRLGVAGSGWATTLTRIMMLVTLVIFVLARDHKYRLGLAHASLKFHFNGIKQVVRLGVPAGFQLLFEVAVFSLSTALAGRLGSTPLAAHSIVLNIASFTFMVPLGISAAAAVRVGQAVGQGEPKMARAAGWVCIGLGTAFMAVSAIFLFSAGDHVIGLFTSDESVIQLGTAILMLAAFFQVADGIQTVGTGALRGLGDTHSPMYANFIGHWLVGLPFGYYLCFHTTAGVYGLWAGLTLGLILVAGIVITHWYRRARRVISATTEAIPSH